MEIELGFYTLYGPVVGHRLPWGGVGAFSGSFSSAKGNPQAGTQVTV